MYSEEEDLMKMMLCMCACTCLCVAAGKDHQPGGNQLGSGSDVPLHPVPEDTLKSCRAPAAF